MTGYVDEDDLAATWWTRWPDGLPVDARTIAAAYGAHVDDALAVLNRDGRFACGIDGDRWRSFSAWRLA